MITNRPLLVSDDAELIDDVLRLAAANGVEVHLATDIESARGRWQLTSLVIVGDDLARAAAAAHLTRRRDVLLVTRDAENPPWELAVQIGADHVVSLPEAERWLIDRLADSSEGPARGGRVLSIVGAGGGAGASTFAATLAGVAAARPLRVLLVDADPTAGGLDVLLGLEDLSGPRWTDLVESRGRLGVDALAGTLPEVLGVAVLSWGRDGPAQIGVEAVTAVLDAGVRGFDLVIVDLPRHEGPVTDLLLSRTDVTLVVTTGRVRSIAAAARLLPVLRGRCAAVRLVVRQGRGASIDESVLSALGADVVARLPSSAAVAARADEGDPPALRDAYARACLEALVAVLPVPARPS